MREYLYCLHSFRVDLRVFFFANRSKSVNEIFADGG